MSRWRIKRIYRNGPGEVWRDVEDFVLEYENAVDPNFVVPGDDRLFEMIITRLPDAED